LRTSGRSLSWVMSALVLPDEELVACWKWRWRD
jgi:hypothetical protein